LPPTRQFRVGDLDGDLIQRRPIAALEGARIDDVGESIEGKLVRPEAERPCKHPPKDLAAVQIAEIPRIGMADQLRSVTLCRCSNAHPVLRAGRQKRKRTSPFPSIESL
jgi:hypothetical protein